MINKQDLDKRVEQAVENFESGYNCAQSVFSAFADLYGLDNDLALRLSSSFGGGIGKMRQTCGAACGIFMLAGLEKGTNRPKDNESRKRVYQLIQYLATEFKKQNSSINCGELLGLTLITSVNASPEALANNDFKKHPCIKTVESAARIWAGYILDKSK